MKRAVLFLATMLAASSSWAQSDDFNDTNDNGWTRFQPLSSYGASGTYSVPLKYRIQAAASTNVALLGSARAASLGTNVTYTNFAVSVDVVDWNNSLTQAFGPMARIREPGFATGDGYGLLLYTTGIIAINRFDNEAPTVIAQSTITLNTNIDYRLVFSGLGSSLKGQIFATTNLITPLATLTVTDGTYSSGYSGLLVAAVENTSSSADAWFDNYSANAGDLTVYDAITSLATNGTKNYTFTDFSSGDYVTIAVTMSAYSTSTNGTAVFTLLDGSTRLGINAGDNSGNWIDGTEKVKFSASLVSASSRVDTNSVRFAVSRLGIRPNSGAMSWTSSVSTKSVSSTGETNYLLDTATASIANTNYSGQLSPGQAQLSDFYSYSIGQSIGLTVSFSEIQISAGSQVGGVENTNAPSLSFIDPNKVLVAANFGGTTMVRDGISFTGITTTSNPMTNTFGAYNVILSAPSGGLASATFGDALFGTFIWADNQNQMTAKIDGLNTNKKYALYYLAGDSRALAFNMFLTLTGTNATDTNFVVGTMSWGGGSTNGQQAIYLPVTVSNATSITATMTKNGSSSGVSMSGVILVENSDAPTLTTISTLTNATEDNAFTITYDTLKNASDAADANGDAISFRVEALSSGTLTKNGTNVVEGSTLLSTGESFVWTPATNANGTLGAFSVRAWDGSAASASTVQVNVNVAAINDGPRLNGTVPIQSAAYGDFFSYTFPADLFIDVDSTLSYAFSFTEAYSFPSWLSFDGASRTFSGTANRAGNFGGVLGTSDGDYSANTIFQVSVSKATLTITPADANRSFGQTNPVFTGTIVGLKNGDNITATYSTTATSSSPAGTYPIVATLSDPNNRLSNYNVTTNQGTLTITNSTACFATIAFGTSSVCVNSSGNQATGPGGMATYDWKVENGTANSGTNAQTVTFTAGAAGQVRVTLTVGDGFGCTATTTNYITVTPNITSATIVAATNVCTGSTGNQAIAAVNVTKDSTDDRLGTITAQGENGSGEGAAMAFDNNPNTKWLDFATNSVVRASWIQYQYEAGTQRVVTKYTITSANDGQQRDPANWRIVASNDGGANWTTLDSQTAQVFTNRFEKHTYALTNTTAYNIYRLQIDSVYNPAGANSVQLSELEFLETPAETLTYAWTITNGTILSATNEATINYTAGSSGAVGLNVIVSNDGCSTTAATTNVDIAQPPGVSIVVAGSGYCPNGTGYTASGPDGMAAYAWTISNGTITSATNLQTITFSVGTSGNVGLSLLVTSAAGCDSGDYTESAIIPYASAEITTSSNVTANSTGNSASAPAGAASYAWSISNGTITSATNVQTITYTAGSTGSVGLALTVGNAAGCTASSVATATITAPIVPPNPLPTSWVTNTSGQYVRLYTNAAAMTAGATVTTWTFSTINGTNVTGTQATPVYSGIQEIYSSTNWLYIRSSAMPVGPIGPLIAYGNAALLLPYNQKAFYRIPMHPSFTNNKVTTPGGAIGYTADGVQMFDIRDALSWTGSSEGTGTGYWTRDAYINEGYGFDPYQAHAAPGGGYHYHANPQGLRYVLGDHVNYNPATKLYSESTNAVTKHSPILGWLRDGYPLYGPYGYSSASNSASGIRRMISGFVLRNGANGTANLSVTGRTNIPPWAQRIYGVSSATGPSVASYGPLGRYLEDNDFMGDLINPSTSLPFVKGVDYDLDEYNGRWCVTPEFPNGTYAYFVTINADGSAKFPYYIGRAFFGTPAGGSVTNLTETVVTNFVGGTNMPLKLNIPVKNNNSVTLTWSGVDGGSYKVESSTDLSTWNSLITNAPAPKALGSHTNTATEPVKTYRVTRTAVATFDPVNGTATGGGGGGTGSGILSVSPTNAVRGSTFTLTINLDPSVSPPPQSAPITSVTVGSITGTSNVHVSQTQVTSSITIPANASTGPQTVTVTFPPPPPGTGSNTVYTLPNGFTIQ